MNTLRTIGEIHSAYVERPTVKAVLVHEGRILTLNDGLLPGGGVEPGETHPEALRREIREEIGAEITSIQEIGSVIQYRKFLSKKYVVYGFICELVTFSGEVDPQDEGEARFTQRWLTKEALLVVLDRSIKRYENLTQTDDSIQGKLYNLKTARELVKNAIF